MSILRRHRNSTTGSDEASLRPSARWADRPEPAPSQPPARTPAPAPERRPDGVNLGPQLTAWLREQVAARTTRTRSPR